MKRPSQFWFGIVLILILALALASCGGSAQPSTGGAASTPTANDNASGNQVVVTTDNYGKAVDMKVGQVLLVKLGEGDNCQVDVTPTFLLNEVTDVTLNPGEQGAFKATMNGKATVQATCKSGQFNISININP